MYSLPTLHFWGFAFGELDLLELFVHVYVIFIFFHFDLSGFDIQFQLLNLGSPALGYSAILFGIAHWSLCHFEY